MNRGQILDLLLGRSVRMAASHYEQMRLGFLRENLKSQAASSTCYSPRVFGCEGLYGIDARSLFASRKIRAFLLSQSRWRDAIAMWKVPHPSHKAHARNLGQHGLRSPH